MRPAAPPLSAPCGFSRLCTAVYSEGQSLSCRSCSAYSGSDSVLRHSSARSQAPSRNSFQIVLSGPRSELPFFESVQPASRGHARVLDRSLLPRPYPCRLRFLWTVRFLWLSLALPFVWTPLHAAPDSRPRSLDADPVVLVAARVSSRHASPVVSSLATPRIPVAFRGLARVHGRSLLPRSYSHLLRPL